MKLKKWSKIVEEAAAVQMIEICQNPDIKFL